MGGCASRPKESDMNNEEGSIPNKPISETVVAKENNTEDSEKQEKTETKTETTETTTVEAKETFQVEPTKETTPAAEREVAVVEESSSTDEVVVAAPENAETVAVPTENTDAPAHMVAVTAPAKVEVATEATKVSEDEPVKEESKKEEKEVVVTV